MDSCPSRLPSHDEGSHSSSDSLISPPFCSLIKGLAACLQTDEASRLGLHGATLNRPNESCPTQLENSQSLLEAPHQPARGGAGGAEALVRDKDVLVGVVNVP